MPWSSSGIDWTAPPAVGDDVAFAPPAIEQFELANRMRVLVVERHRIPLVSIVTVHGAAGSREDGARRGLAALCADVLREADAEALDRAGATLDASIATDYSTLAMSVVADHVGDGIGLLATALRKPRFDDADLSRIRAERLAELVDREDRAHLIAARLFDAVVFGEHPYARASDGRAASLRAITPGDLRAFWRRAYSPEATTMIVVGDVTRASLEPLLAKAFGDWTATAAAPRTRSEEHTSELQSL